MTSFFTMVMHPENLKSSARLAAYLLVLTSLLAGCQQKVATESVQPTRPMAAVTEGSTSVSRDAIASPVALFQVEIFVITVPLGTISANEEFWKRIDEHCVDPGTSDLLYKNGMRVGEASKAEMEHFAKYMEGITPIHRVPANGIEVKDIPVEMKKGLVEQLIFHFNRRNIAVGRSFDGSDNFMNVSFTPAPRKPGQLRVTLCPMIRSTRAKLQWSALGSEVAFKYDIPEMFYDVNFTVDLSANNYMVVSPSMDASRPTSLGNAFLIKESAAEKQEQVILVTFKPYKISGPGVVR